MYIGYVDQGTPPVSIPGACVVLEVGMVVDTITLVAAFAYRGYHLVVVQIHSTVLHQVLKPYMSQNVHIMISLKHLRGIFSVELTW